MYHIADTSKQSVKLRHKKLWFIYDIWYIIRLFRYNGDPRDYLLVI